jgi:hypothetical protein
MGGCASTYEKREVNYKRVSINRPTTEVSEDQLFGVRIKTFDPGKIPEDEDKSLGISQEIRKAEGYYVAVNLKNTMQRSGHWGPVRVVHADSNGGEVTVTGRIIESDGEILHLGVSVQDASGSTWFSKEYKGVVNANIYDNARGPGDEAFQFLYTQIANDIAGHQQKIPQKEVRDIRQIAELRFATDFAPDVFSGYLQKGTAKKEENPLEKLFTVVSSEEEDQYQILRLPAEDDPMLKRVRRIRARDDLLIDTLDQQYEGLSRDIREAYTQWRVSRLKEMNSLRKREKLRDKQVGEAIVIGALSVAVGVAAAALGSRANCGVSCAAAAGNIAGVGTSIALQQAAKAFQDAGADAKIHKAALEEIGQSLADQVNPISIEVEGEMVTLKGTAESKFQQWREILKKLHEREVGLTQKSPSKKDSETVLSN